MDPLDTRDKTSLTASVSDYLDALEMIDGQPTTPLTPMTNTSMQGQAAQMQGRAGERAGLCPVKFRCRARLGRGGRIVIDRLAVPREDVSAVTTNYTPVTSPSIGKEKNITTKLKTEKLLSNGRTYIQTTSLRSVSTPTPLSLPLTSTSQLSSGMTPRNMSSAWSSADGTATSGPSPALHVGHVTPRSTLATARFPVCMPPERPVPSIVLYSREQELYSLSDSDDEVVDIQELDNVKEFDGRSLAANDASAFKYSLHA